MNYEIRTQNWYQMSLKMRYSYSVQGILVSRIYYKYIYITLLRVAVE